MESFVGGLDALEGVRDVRVKLELALAATARRQSGGHLWVSKRHGEQGNMAWQHGDMATWQGSIGTSFSPEGSRGRHQPYGQVSLH